MLEVVSQFEYLIGLMNAFNGLLGTIGMRILATPPLLALSPSLGPKGSMSIFMTTILLTFMRNVFWKNKRIKKPPNTKIRRLI